MDLDDLTPAGGGSLRGPAASVRAEPVATFTRSVVQHPDTIWSPRGSEIAPPQRPLPGHGFEHEPVNRAERAAQHTARNVARGSFDYAEVARGIRSALRPGV